MKKLALLIGGEYRNFSQQFPTWKFLDQIDYDIFMSTWSQSNVSTDKLVVRPEWTRESITKEKILSVVGKTPIYLNVEHEINFEHRGNKQIYHWQRLLIALINLHKDYDYAIITRPDVEIKQPDDIVSALADADPYKIYGASTVNVTVPPEWHMLTVNDIFFMATPKVLIDILLPVPYMKMKSSEELITGKGDNFHSHLANYFVSNNIYINQASAGILIVRGIEMTEDIENLSRYYFKLIEEKDIANLTKIFDKDIHLVDWNADVTGREQVLIYNKNLFERVGTIQIDVIYIVAFQAKVFAEINVIVDGVITRVLDVITFNKVGIIVKIEAYKFEEVPENVLWERKLAELRKRDPFIYK
jgi:hypothetical protein